MKTTISIAIAVMLLAASGCADGIDGDKKGWSVTEFEENTDSDDKDLPDRRNDRPDIDPDRPDPDPDPDTDPDIDPDIDPRFPGITSAFVAGHLGNYLDCPEQGYQEAANGVSGEAGDGFGACEDGSTCILNCEPAQLTIQVSNEGELDLNNVRITRLELFNMDGDFVAELPVLAVVDEAGMETTPSLRNGEKALLRIDYMGPANPYELLRNASGQSGVSGTMTIVIEADDAESDVLETPELHTLPAIAT